MADYRCPNCRGRLTSFQSRKQDFFCKACCTAVAIVDQAYCLVESPSSRFGAVREPLSVLTETSGDSVAS